MYRKFIYFTLRGYRTAKSKKKRRFSAEKFIFHYEDFKSSKIFTDQTIEREKLPQSEILRSEKVSSRHLAELRENRAKFELNFPPKLLAQIDPP
jgi:hypothetical protein